MDDYDDYDDDDDIVSVDSDDDEIKFVSSKRKFKFTTFGDEEREDDGDDGKESSIYGVFAQSRPSRTHDKASSTPMFVKGASKPAVEEEDSKPAATKPNVPPVEEVDEEAKQAEEAQRKQQAEANQKFYALLGRGRGEKRPRRTFQAGDGPTELQQQSGGLGFQAAAGGIGFQSEGGGGGLGFKSSNVQDNVPQFGGLGSPPSNFGDQPPPPPIKVDPNLGKWEKHTKGIGMKLLAKMGYKGSGGLGAKKKRDEEALSKGGISRPVEVVVRPNNLGLGFGNFREASKLKANQHIEAEMRGEELPKTKEEKKKDAMGGPAHKSSALPSTDELMGQQSWKRGAKQVSSKRQKRTVVPYTELLEKQKQPAIIDMRGPSAASRETGEVPLAAELLHNVSVLLNTYENKLHSTSHFLQASKQKLQSLQSDLDGMQRRKTEGQQRISKLQKVLRVVDNIDDMFTGSDGSADMVDKVRGEVQSMVEELRGELSEEDRVALQFDQVLVPSLLSPLINSSLDQWDPLRDNSEKAKSIVGSLLDLGSGNDEAEVVQERKLSILSRDVLPKVKAAYESTQWNPVRDVEAGVALYEAILSSVDKHLSVPKESTDDTNVFAAGDVDNTSLSDLIARDLLRQTIFPKIMRVLSQWKAELDRTETRIEDGLESWLLPWMPHFDHPATLTQLSSDLKRKVRSALSCLSRSVVDNADFLRSSIATLRPWRTLLKKESVFDLTSKYITPRLVKTFSRVSIASNPDQQDWFVVVTLIDLYNMGLMTQLEFVSLVEGELLAMWAQELHGNLDSQREPNVEQLARFYSAWKHKVLGSPSSMSYRLLNKDLMICRIFYSGLKIIETAMSEKPKELASMTPRTSTYREVLARRSKEERNRNEEDLERLQAKDAVEFRKRVMSRQYGGTATFREVVEDFAREHDISFRPRTGGKHTTDDGKPIFLFGSVPIYLDTNVIFALQDAKWKPLAMEHLVALSQNQ